MIVVLIVSFIKKRYDSDSIGQTPYERRLLKSGPDEDSVLRSVCSHYRLPPSCMRPYSLSGGVWGYTIGLSINNRQMRYTGTVDAPEQNDSLRIFTIKYGGGSRKTVLPESGNYTGDPDFDLYIAVEGMGIAETLAFMDYDTRKALIHVKNYTSRFTITSSHGEFIMPMEYGTAAIKNITLVFDSFIRLMKKAGQEAEIRERLLSNIRRESLPGFRLRNLEVMAETYPGDDSLLFECKKLLFDPDRRLASFAFSLLADDGVPALYTGLEALHQPGRYPPVTGLETAVRLLAEKEGPRCLDSLIGHFHHPNFKNEQIHLLHAISRIGGKKAEDFLCTLLLNLYDTSLLGIAVAALVENGTAEAVEPLGSVAKNQKLPSEIREAAQTAIERIKKRIGPIEKGMLSISDKNEKSGGLSIAENGGGLSEIDDNSEKKARPETVPGPGRITDT